MENKIIIVSAQTDAEYPNVLWTHMVDMMAGHIEGV